MTRFLLGGWCATWTLLVLSPSVHAQACETDADCPDWLACEHGPSISVDCGPENCDAGAPVSSGAQCEAQVVTCATDADCPLGLTCEDAGPGQRRRLHLHRSGQQDPGGGSGCGLGREPDVRGARSCRA